MATSWFGYNRGAINNPTSYSRVLSAPVCPSPNELLCAVFAQIQTVSGVERPILTPIQTEIDNAVATLTETGNVSLRPE